MTFIGNNGVEVKEEMRDTKTYYVCSDGVEFLFVPDSKVNFVGNDGTELAYNEDKSMLISNNGNDAVIKRELGVVIIEFLDGTVFSNVGSVPHYGILDKTQLENFVLS